MAEPFEIIEVLKQGLKYIDADGWIKGTLYISPEQAQEYARLNIDEHAGYCMLGAINKAATGEPSPPEEVLLRTQIAHEALPAAEALLEAVQDSTGYLNAYAEPEDVYKFNDGGTLKEVRRAFHLAIENLEKKA